ncbi:MAG: hypothetical protein M1407_02875 [Deltaproteobacteria bacterium]|nr:hypothetical protein [Deltaproteobacteria bacterium]
MKQINNMILAVYKILLEILKLSSKDLFKNKKLVIFFAVIMLFAFNLSGWATYSIPNAYSSGFISVSTPNLAFSFGDGVNAYYYPPFQTYIYGYNGYYYRWYNNNWIYASAYSGPWFPLPPTVYLPAPLLYGPPPPIITYRPYFIWWRSNIGPWYRINHPGWWVRHHAYLRHYNSWRSHVGRFYANHPSYRPKMRKIFRRNAIRNRNRAIQQRRNFIQNRNNRVLKQQRNALRNRNRVLKQQRNAIRNRNRILRRKK